MMTADSTRRVLGLLGTVQNGVIEMSRDVPGLVGFSRNLGVVKTNENSVSFIFSSRSALESQLDASVDSLDALAAALGGKTRHYSRYPGWSYAQRSPIRNKYLKAATRVLGYEPKVMMIHAGLECGLFADKIKDLDCISFGPNIPDIHTTNEKLDVASTQRVWEFLLKLLQSL